MRRALLGALALLGVLGVPALGRAAPAVAKLDPVATVNATVAQALYTFSATKAAADRAADARIFEQRKQIEQLQAQGALAAAKLASAQQQYVAELEKRDRAYAEAVAVFRKAVVDICATPEGEAALRRFNAGDEPGALAVLDRLRAAHNQARVAAVKIESAAEGRRIATLALEARNRGKQDTNSVITRYEEVTNLDSGVFGDWVEMGKLYQDAGRLPAAREAARGAALAARDDGNRAIAWAAEADVAVEQGDLAGARTRFQETLKLLKRLAATDPRSASLQRNVSVSLDRVGDVLVAQGDLAGALGFLQQSLELRKGRVTADPGSTSLQRDVSVSLIKLGGLLAAQGDLTGARGLFEQSLQLRNGLVAADPSSTSLQRDVSVSLDRVGDVLVAQGDLAGALGHFQKCLEICKHLAGLDPGSARLQRDVWCSLTKLGDVLVAQGDLVGALERFQEGLELIKRLVAADPSSASLQRDISISFEQVGNVLVKQGDLAGARGHFQHSLEIRKRLSVADASSATLKRDVWVSLTKLGDVLVAQGDLAGARGRFQESLDIARRLAAASPTSAVLQRDVLVSMWQLVNLGGSGINWAKIAAAMEDMQRRGVLGPLDMRFLEQVRRNAEAEKPR